MKIEYIDLRSEDQAGLVCSDIDAINSLLAELSPNARAIDKDALISMLSGCRIVMAFAGDKVIGMGSLVPIQQLTGCFARVEDVVVDPKVRNLGVGRGILEKLIEIAMDLGVSRVDLSSKPERVAANKLYESFGFVRRDTNVYRLEF